MIDVAITGLYLSDRPRWSALAGLAGAGAGCDAEATQEINLLPSLRQGLNAERAASYRTFEITPPSELVKWFAFGGDDHSLWGRLKNPRFLLIRFAPRGWLYQNMCAGAIENRLFGDMPFPRHHRAWSPPWLEPRLFPPTAIPRKGTVQRAPARRQIIEDRTVTKGSGGFQVEVARGNASKRHSLPRPAVAVPGRQFQ